ncbi:hypothetical protein KY285_023868 [Solanum tuberosum]|nr:hypothetical protein KY289_024199 [Solanum tuberosum]KAH0676067.1 hypothetical protein KY285_023868 [Solanum tuberosum]
MLSFYIEYHYDLATIGLPPPEPPSSIQKVCGNIRDFHGLIVNGNVEHESVEYVLPQLQPMAEK